MKYFKYIIKPEDLRGNYDLMVSVKEVKESEPVTTVCEHDNCRDCCLRCISSKVD